MVDLFIHQVAFLSLAKACHSTSSETAQQNVRKWIISLVLMQTKQIIVRNVFSQKLLIFVLTRLLVLMKRVSI